MWRTIKMKMLGVIVLVAIVGLIMQSESSGRIVVEPVLKYIMQEQYDVGALISRYIPILETDELSRMLPVSGGVLLHQPCNYLEIERQYGPYWSQDNQKQNFNEGILLKVMENSEVKPILEGQVAEIGQDTVVISHNIGNLSSVYGGLKDIRVTAGSTINQDTIIGHTGQSFYFEVRGKDGPVNPQSIFN